MMRREAPIWDRSSVATARNHWAQTSVPAWPLSALLGLWSVFGCADRPSPQPGTTHGQPATPAASPPADSSSRATSIDQLIRLTSQHWAFDLDSLIKRR